MSAAHTVAHLLARGGDNDPAIAAPGRVSLTYMQLRAHVQRSITSLNARGIGRNDPVAMVLRNGPEMATAFVAIAAAAAAAPLNPAYRREEFEFYLSDCRAKALVVEQGISSAAMDAAAALRIPVFPLEVKGTNPAGLFQFAPGQDSLAASNSGGYAITEDTAVLLHTSGTTSRPKAVPLTHRNVCASAHHICETLKLTPADCCLNIMPLFHIHGLVATVLSTLGAGGTVFCTSGFNALKFFRWMNEAKPTWYSAVPTMHQAIIARAEQHQDVVHRTPLRFIRSSSSPLPPKVMKGLEATFAVPVIEAYAMTEAAYQITSNPLPPLRRKPGSVGRAAGPAIAIMDQNGRFLPYGSVGEVVIRGPNVTPGYVRNPRANAASFTKGWFRTGDQGVLDADGYLTITGRLKEIINQGGEKISPREVDAVIMDHPAVLQVATFPMPHPKLGEQVAAAIVLRVGEHATVSDICDYAARRLASFKVPRRIFFVDEIPKSPLGKLRRFDLAKQLGAD